MKSDVITDKATENMDMDDYFTLDNLILVLNKTEKDEKPFYTLKIYIHPDYLKNKDGMDDMYFLNMVRADIEAIYDDTYSIRFDNETQRYYLRFDTEYFSSIYDLIYDLMYETSNTQSQRYKIISIAVNEVEKFIITKGAESSDFQSVINKFISCVNKAYLYN